MFVPREVGDVSEDHAGFAKQESVVPENGNAFLVLPLRPRNQGSENPVLRNTHDSWFL